MIYYISTEREAGGQEKKRKKFLTKPARCGKIIESPEEGGAAWTLKNKQEERRGISDKKFEGNF